MPCSFVAVHRVTQSPSRLSKGIPQSRMSIGRHRLRYPELGANDTDLAIARFGRASVSCWTSPSNRVWGIHGQRKAAVMRFHVEANPGCEDGVLRNFELELKFSSISQDTLTLTIPTAESATPQEDANCDESQVCLIGPPAPRYLQQDGKWTFSSDRLSDEQTGHALAARWTWESPVAHELRKRVLHGGVALYHPGQPFHVVCHVRGRVTKPRNIILKFSDNHHKPRSWKLTPQICEQDLQAEINALEGRMKDLNTSATSVAHADVSTRGDAPTSNMNQLIARPPVASTYGGDSSIGGEAKVQFGNNYYYNSLQQTTLPD